MSEWFIWLLTKTMIPRAIAMAIAGGLLSWGLLSEDVVQREMWTPDGQKVIVEESQKNLVGEALTLLIVGGLSLFIEQKKAVEVKKTQELLDEVTPEHIEVKVDGLAGPETRQAVKTVAASPPIETESKPKNRKRRTTESA